MVILVIFWLLFYGLQIYEKKIFGGHCQDAIPVPPAKSEKIRIQAQVCSLTKS
jgi:hypothetical protein